MLSGADIFVFPTYYPNECFPLVLLEAMEHGLPCVSTNEGGIAGIIDDGKTGFIVDRLSAEQLAEKIGVLIDNPEIAGCFGAAGMVKFKQEYTLRRFEERIIEVFGQALGNC